jgi:predicted DNA-binding transcriptional regulator AlpA
MENQCDSAASADALIARFLGSRYLGRRYLRYAELEALGICDNRGSLVNWMRAGAFPRGIKIPSRYGKTLVWDAVEIAQHIAQRCAEREFASPDISEGGASRDRPLFDSRETDPFAPGRSEHKASCPYPTDET